MLSALWTGNDVCSVYYTFLAEIVTTLVVDSLS